MNGSFCCLQHIAVKRNFVNYAYDAFVANKARQSDTGMLATLCILKLHLFDLLWIFVQQAVQQIRNKSTTNRTSGIWT